MNIFHISTRIKWIGLTVLLTAFQVISAQETLSLRQAIDFALKNKVDASKVINADGENIQQQAKGIHEVIDLVKTIPDKVLQESYADNLVNVYSREEMWKREIMGIQSLPAPTINTSMDESERISAVIGSTVSPCTSFGFTT